MLDFLTKILSEIFVPRVTFLTNRILADYQDRAIQVSFSNHYSVLPGTSSSFAKFDFCGLISVLTYVS